MQPSFWQERWAEGRTAFHEGAPNAYLARFVDRLAGASRILVPMCGKAEDVAFLATRSPDTTVVGVELVETAVQQFFAEHALVPEQARHGEHAVYTSGPITLVAGDIFSTTRELLGPFDAIYDRAALVALPADMRARYVAHLRALSPAGTRVLLVTLEYDQALADGPPFCVSPEEVRALYAGATIEDLASGPDTRPKPNHPPMIERCYAITL